jgi:predicted RNA-binding protein
MPERLGDAPIEEAYRRKMNDLADALDTYFNGALRGEKRHTGFCLMVFRFGEGGRANYISNANREDVVTLLKEQLARFEGQPELKGKA